MTPRRRPLSVIIRDVAVRSGAIVVVKLPSGRSFEGRAVRMFDADAIRVFLPDEAS